MSQWHHISLGVQVKAMKKGKKIGIKAILLGVKRKSINMKNQITVILLKWRLMWLHQQIYFKLKINFLIANQLFVITLWKERDKNYAIKPQIPQVAMNLVSGLLINYGFQIKIKLLLKRNCKILFKKTGIGRSN